MTPRLLVAIRGIVRWRASALCGVALSMMSQVLIASGASHAQNATITVAPVTAEQWRVLDHRPDWLGVWTPTGSRPSVFADCCVPGADHLPLTPAYRKRRDEVARDIARGLPAADNLTQCEPDGIPGVMTHGIAFEILYQPREIVMLLEDGEVRRIFTDERSHPSPDDLFNSPEGHSIGRWDGNTLVVDTIGMKTTAELFALGDIHVTRTTHVEERISLTDPDTLEIATAVTDPKIFVAPYRYSIFYSRRLRDSFVSGCLEFSRIDQSGKLQVPAE